MAKPKLHKVVQLQEATASKSELFNRRVFGLKDPVVRAASETRAEGSPWIALKYLDTSHECFSAWGSDELRLFSGFIETLRQCSWEAVQRHNGLRLKTIDVETIACGREALKRVQKKVSPDITFFELRVSRGVRVHGFRVAEAFFLVLLDREHRLYPE